MTDSMELTDDQLNEMGEALLERMVAAEKEKTRIILDSEPEPALSKEIPVPVTQLTPEAQDEIRSEAASAMSKEQNDPVVPPKMTRKVWKEMMRIHFTVRRATVKSCGHKINIQSDPRNNCDECWFAYFNNNGQMTQIADECFTEAGRDVLTRSRGKKFVKYFLKFMSTIARFQREAAAAKIAEKEANHGVEAESTTLDGTVGGRSPATDTSIGGIVGEAESIGGLNSDPSGDGFISENPINEGSDEGTGISIG